MTDTVHNHNLDNAEWIRDKSIKRIKVITSPEFTFICGTSSEKQFEEIKKYVCYVRLMKLVWDSDEFKILNIDNDSESRFSYRSIKRV